MNAPSVRMATLKSFPWYLQTSLEQIEGFSRVTKVFSMEASNEDMSQNLQRYRIG